MEKAKRDPVILPDVFDPTVPVTELIPPLPADEEPSPDAGQRQPQKQPQTEPLEPGKDTDIGGGD